ncbi:MAG: hypothetical protein ACRDK2_15825 [Solirubrobacteraceae bacterium]
MREPHLDRVRAESFGTVAAQYDSYRSTYPGALFDDLAALAPAQVLDVGCDTGMAATASFVVAYRCSVWSRTSRWLPLPGATAFQSKWLPLRPGMTPGGSSICSPVPLPGIGSTRPWAPPRRRMLGGAIHTRGGTYLLLSRRT